MLNQLQLKDKIKKLSNEMLKEEDREQALEKYSNDLAKIITDYIKTATITVPAGQNVQVDPVTGIGVTIAPIRATIV